MIESFAKAPLLRQLRVLDLVHSKVSERGLQRMLDDAAAFAGLHEISLFHDASPEAAARLRRRLPHVKLRPAA